MRRPILLKLIASNILSKIQLGHLFREVNLTARSVKIVVCKNIKRKLVKLRWEISRIILNLINLSVNFHHKFNQPIHINMKKQNQLK